MHGALGLVVLVAVLTSGFACAGHPFESGHPFENAARASDEELDRLRGGFVVDMNGSEFLMPFSIDSIERVTQINGQTWVDGELTTASLNPLALIPIGDAGLGASAVTSAGAATTMVSLHGQMLVIQNAPGDSATPALNVEAESLGTLIQNSANDQVIRNFTTLNIRVDADLLAAQARLSTLVNDSLRGLR